MALTQRWAVNINRPKQPWGCPPVGKAWSSVLSQRSLCKTLGTWNVPTLESQNGGGKCNTLCEGTKDVYRSACVDVAGFVLCAFIFPWTKDQGEPGSHISPTTCSISEPSIFLWSCSFLQLLWMWQLGSRNNSLSLAWEGDVFSSVP